MHVFIIIYGLVTVTVLVYIHACMYYIVVYVLSLSLLQSVNEYAPDVAAAREQTNLQLRFADNTRKELLKKLHRVRA